MALPTFTVATTYPCCGGRAVFRLMHDLPRQRFTRRCARCAEDYDRAPTYDVMVTTREPRPGVRVHVISWVDNEAYTRRGHNPRQ